MLRQFSLIVPCLLGILLLSSRPALPELPEAGGDTLKFLFFGHAYDWQSTGNRVDPRVTGLNLNKYQRVFMGGDICSEAMLDYSTLEYLDSIFDLDDPNTHYVLGNHDARNENFEWYEEVCERKTYSTHSANGVTVMVLNSTLNPGDCEALDAQFRMLSAVCDTISASSHLIVLQHHGIWKFVPGLTSNQWKYSNWPFKYWDANCFGDSTLYHQTIYPKLVEVQQRGVQVVNVLGDAGVLVKQFAAQTPDSIWYLSSGIDNSRYANDSLALDSAKKDKLLLFEHIPEERELSWKFIDLDSLYDVDN